MSNVHGLQAKRCSVFILPLSRSPSPTLTTPTAVHTSATSATTELTIPASTSFISKTPKVRLSFPAPIPSPHSSTVKSFNGCGYCKVYSPPLLRSPPSSPPSVTVGSLKPETHRVQQPWLARLLPAPHPNRAPYHTTRRLAHRQHRTQHTHAPGDKVCPRRYPLQKQYPPSHHIFRSDILLHLGSSQ